MSVSEGEEQAQVCLLAVAGKLFYSNWISFRPPGTAQTEGLFC